MTELRSSLDKPGSRVLPGLAALLLTQLVCVSSTNFGGFDEWLMFELNTRGIVSVPHAYRPLGLIWSVPGSLLAPRFGFAVFTPLYAFYALLSAGLVFWFVRRLQPERPLLALLTACFTLVWAPSDLARLSTVERAVYQGITFGTLLAAALLLEAWQRRSVPLFGVSTLMAFVAIRCYEGGAALLAGFPALLLLTKERSRRLWLWALLWELVVGVALLFFLLEMSITPRTQSYQLSVRGLHLGPTQWLVRMSWQYILHLGPLLLTPKHELLAPAVPAAVAVFGLLLALVRYDPVPETGGRRSLATTGLIGLALAGLGYSVILLGVDTPAAFRLQFLSGPGVALCLASLALLLASMLPARARFLGIGLLAAWVVAVGTGRTVAMQDSWNKGSVYGRQMGMLRGLTRVVPNVVPHTLVLLLDDGGACRAGFTFQHAVLYLYEGRAAGYVIGRQDPLYSAAFVDEGIRFEPWSVIRRAWDAPRTQFRYDELVVVRHAPDGQVLLLEDWPGELAPLPPGARYAPRARLAPGPLALAGILRP
jgi:hypothetical protein